MLEILPYAYLQILDQAENALIWPFRQWWSKKVQKCRDQVELVGEKARYSGRAALRVDSHRKIFNGLQSVVKNNFHFVSSFTLTFNKPGQAISL